MKLFAVISAALYFNVALYMLAAFVFWDIAWGALIPIAGTDFRLGVVAFWAMFNAMFACLALIE